MKQEICLLLENKKNCYILTTKKAEFYIKYRNNIDVLYPHYKPHS